MPSMHIIPWSIFSLKTKINIIAKEKMLIAMVPPFIMFMLKRVKLTLSALKFGLSERSNQSHFVFVLFFVGRIKLSTSHGQNLLLIYLKKSQH